MGVRDVVCGMGLWDGCVGWSMFDGVCGMECVGCSVSDPVCGMECVGWSVHGMECVGCSVRDALQWECKKCAGEL